MLVIADRFGQLGNRLELFSHFMAFALEHNHTIFNPSFCEYAKYFQATQKDPFCCYPSSSVQLEESRLLRELIFYAVHYPTLSIRFLSKLGIHSQKIKVLSLSFNNTLNLDSPAFIDSIAQEQILLCKGWEFRVSEAIFTKHGDAIRQHFVPLKLHVNNITSLIQKIRKKCDVLVGIHIRQGDYKKFMGGQFFYQVEDYTHLMKVTEVLFPNQKVGFLICSNSKQSPQSFADFEFMFANGHLVEDMYALAECDYIMGPPSTYTSWASFYGQVPLYRIRDVKASLSLESFATYMGQENPKIFTHSSSN